MIFYEKYCEINLQYETDEQFLANSFDFYAFQRKYQFELIIQIATYMDQHGIRQLDIQRGGEFWSLLQKKESSGVLFFEQFIPIVFGDDEEEFYEEKYKWNFLREMEFSARNELKHYLSKLTISDAAKFVKEHYNILEHHVKSDFGTIDNPNRKRIKLARDIMRQFYM